MSDVVTIQLTVEEARRVVRQIEVVVRAASDRDNKRESGSRPTRIREDSMRGALAFVERLEGLLPDGLAGLGVTRRRPSDPRRCRIGPLE